MRECSRTQKRFSLLFLMFASFTLVLVAFAFDRGVNVMMHYTCPMVFAFAGFTLFAGRYGRQAELWAGVAFVSWYVLSRILMKEFYLTYSFSMFSNLCCAYLLAFPFARCMNDGQKKTGLIAASAVFITGYGLLAWLGVLSALLGGSIELPFLGTHIRMYSDLRLWAGNHPNISACMFMTAIVLGVWLAVKTRRRWVAVPVALVCLGAYLAVSLAVSRTVMLQLGSFAALLVMLAILRLNIPSKGKKWAVGLLAGIVSLVLVFISFDWAAAGITALANRMTAHAEAAAPAQVVATRSLLRDLSTMTGRTAIYQDILELIAEQPKILLTGMLNSDIVQVLLTHAGVEHAHNSFLQTLLNTGIPGLLLAVYFTVRAIRVSAKLLLSRKACWEDQILGAILLVFLIGTIPESYLFTEYLTIANMPFFLIFGYALEAERALRADP